MLHGFVLLVPIVSLLVGCAAPPAGRAERTWFLPVEPAVEELAVRAGLVQVLVHAPWEPAHGRRGQIVTAGSGTLLDWGGIVATAAHVAIDLAHHLSVRTLDGRTLQGFTVHFDQARDLALVCVPALRGVRGAVPAIEPPEEAGPVLGFGFPEHNRLAIAAGRIRRAIVDHGLRYGSFGIDRPIELELPIAPGYSGGPVLDRRGRLIGILVGFAKPVEGEPRHILDVAYAVPARLLAEPPVIKVVQACLADQAA